MKYEGTSTKDNEIRCFWHLTDHERSADANPVCVRTRQDLPGLAAQVKIAGRHVAAALQPGHPVVDHPVVGAARRAVANREWVTLGTEHFYMTEADVGMHQLIVTHTGQRRTSKKCTSHDNAL